MYDRHDKESFQDRVVKYMSNMHYDGENFTENATPIKKGDNSSQLKYLGLKKPH